MIYRFQPALCVNDFGAEEILPLLGRKLPAGTVHCRDIHKGMFPVCIFCAILHRIVIDSISVLCYTNDVEVNRCVPSGQLEPISMKQSVGFFFAIPYEIPTNQLVCNKIATVLLPIKAGNSCDHIKSVISA